jgi:hypothetical protein
LLGLQISEPGSSVTTETSLRAGSTINLYSILSKGKQNISPNHPERYGPTPHLLTNEYQKYFRRGRVEGRDMDVKLMNNISNVLILIIYGALRLLPHTPS